MHRITTFAALSATAAVGALSSLVPASAVEFGQREVNQNQFVAVAAPYRGGAAHQLLILEQISDLRSCWAEAAGEPTRIDPLLLNFDFTGICGRSTDSNGYSIRVNGEDLGLAYSLRVVRRDGDMLLIGQPHDRSQEELLIGRTNGVTSDFAKIDLESGWRFTKRTYDGRTLGHVYLTYDGSGIDTPTPGGSESPTAPGTPVPPSQELPFRDIGGDIYSREIQLAVEIGFIAGFQEDNTFRPQASLTREQLVSMVLESLERLPGVNLNMPTQVSRNPFRDVSASRWSAAKIQFAQEAGLVSGYGDGSFRPTQPVTRAEMIAVLRQAARYGLELQGVDPTLVPTRDAIAFSDINTHWAGDGITEMSGFCQVASPLNERGNAFFPDTAARRNYAAAATLRTLTCVAQEPVAIEDATQPVAAEEASQQGS
jgi:hypothetical protein